MGKRKHITVRGTARTVLAVIYLVAGVLHLTLPEPFIAITPSWVPFTGYVVTLTGLAELAGAAGFMVPRLRRSAGIGLALYAVVVFPANIQHAMYNLGRPDALSGWWYHGPRLLLQPFIVWWVLWASEAIDWPFARKRQSEIRP